MNKEAERNQRRALGKGLAALLPAREVVTSARTQGGAAALPEQFEEFQNIRLDQIEVSGEQPRERFDEEKLEELAQSIRANGLIQPITVYKAGEQRYRIIAGERRWRAARIAGMQEIPALVRSVEKHQLLELALIENLQREDLNPIEIANAFQRLAMEHGLTHEEIAERTGKDRSSVTNFLRLLRLSPFVRQALVDGRISMGHARALLNITDPEAQRTACDEVIEDDLSVRETEELVKKLAKPLEESPKEEKKTKNTPLDANIRAALDEMAMALGTRVRLISKSGSSGRLEIEYYSQDDLDRIYSVIVKQ